MLLTLACAGEGDAPPPPEQPPEGVHGRAPPAVGGVPSVVTLEPAGGSAGATETDAAMAGAAAAGDAAGAGRSTAAAGTGGEPAPAAADRPPVLDQFGLTFSPRALVVRVGEPFTVTNSEQIPHNVTIRYGENDSTVANADTDPNQRFGLTLDRPGPYHVTCSVHPGMTAFIFATTAPYAAVADGRGAFVVEDVPPGVYTLTVWSADASLGSAQEVTVREGSTKVAPASGV